MSIKIIVFKWQILSFLTIKYSMHIKFENNQVGGIILL
jgi:hypothetical protein